MKQETGKKQNKWLLPVIIAALLVIIGIVVAVFMLGGNSSSQGNQPTEPAAVSGEIYWNINRQDHIDPETGLSVRAAGEDGLYHIMFAYNGKQVELTVNDKKLVNRIDMMDHMALEVDANGNITDVHNTTDVATVAAENFFVQKMEGGTLMVNSSQALNGMEVPFQITENTGIYNVSALAENRGEVDEVEPMDKVVVIQSKDGSATTHVFIVERMIASDIYWRVEQYYNSTKKITTRVPDATGAYTIRFAVNGQQVDLKCKDVEVVSYIDSLANNVQCTGLTFDEQGFITGTVTPANAIRGALVSNQFDVNEITETGFSTIRMLPSSNQGSTWTGNYAADCKFYDVTGVSGFIGIEVDSLKMNDRVYVLTNAMGEAKVVFITNRMVEGDLYWLVGARMYNSTTRKTTMKPDDSGWYVMQFIKNGKIVELKTKDEAIATDVHAQSPQLMGLEVDGNVITKVHHYVRITGGWAAVSGAAVSSINGPIVTTVSSGNTTSLVLNGECTVTNAFEYVEKGYGEYAELQIGDQIYAIRNAGGEIVAIYITGRPVKGAKVYWSVTRKVANNQTTRTPMPKGHEYEGMYEFLVTTDGKKPVKLYAKTKKIADHIDRQYPQSVGLQVSGNVITAAVPAEVVVGGYDMANYCHAEYWINEGYEFYALYRATGNGTKVKYNRDTIIYNVSAGAKNYVGEKASDVTLNDQIHVIADTSGTAKYIYIVGQDVPGDIYYKISETKDEAGNVTFKMVKGGKVVELKAKDADVAAEVRSFTIGMGLHVKNGVITRAFSVASLKDYGGATAANYDVIKISGNKLTMKRTRPSASNQGHEMEVDISGVKLYDVSAGTTTLGKVVKPKIGDRIVFYLNNDGTAPAIGFVTIRCNREGGAFGKCDHCGKTVYWNPWEGDFPANANLEKDNKATHYYMNYNITTSKQAFVGNEKQTLMASVLDLNGKTLKSSTRALGAWYGATLYVLDSSKAQTGTVIGGGAVTTKGDGGGVALTTRGGSIVVNGGTWKVGENHYPITDGGIFNGFSHKDFKAGTITINGGKFYGTDVTGNGSVLASNAPEIIINGGEFFGGSAGNIGGTLACPNSKMTINGGIIHGGVANYGGTISCPNLTVNGGTIETGVAKQLGNCMYVSSSFNVTINGGTVGDVWVNSTWTGAMTITGKPVIENMTIAKGKLIDMTGVTGGSMNITATGAFTTAFSSDAAAQKVANCIQSANEFAEIYVANKQICSKIERCIYGHTATEHQELTAAGTPCGRDELMSWSMWTSATALPTATGNYILTNDVTTSNQTNLKGTNVVLDLNGHDVTYNVPAPRQAGFRVYYLNDSMSSSGETAGATPSTLIITDNSTDVVADQGTIKTVNPPYAPNPNNVTAWTETGAANAVLALTYEGAAAKAEELAKAKLEAEAKPVAEAAAKEAALLKGEEGSEEYKAEYDKVYATTFEAKYAELYDAKFEELAEAEYAPLAETVETNAAPYLVEAETFVQASGEFEVGTEAYIAAVEEKYSELILAACVKMTEDYVNGIITSQTAVHEKGDAGMIIGVGHGNLEILGGNLDSSELSVKNHGGAIYVGAKKANCHAESQNVIISGGSVSGANLNGSAYHGGAIFVDNGANLVVDGGVINGGRTTATGTNSGAIYASGNNAKVTIAGNAVVNPGKAANGDACYIRFGQWTIGGNAVINGGLGVSDGNSANTTTTLTITGTPTIQKLEGSDAASSFYLYNFKNKINLEGLEPGAKIAFSTAGTISQVFADAAKLQALIDAGCFVNDTTNEASKFVVFNGALALGEYELQCVYGHTSHEGDECGEPIELWQKWTSTTSLPNTNGNYFVPEGTTIELNGQPGLVNTNYKFDVKLDLRGATVKQNNSTARVFMLKGATGSQYVVTSTKGQATVKTTFASSTISGGATVLYANVGTLRLINTDVDASSVTTCGHANGLGTVLATGTLVAENCHLIGGATNNGIALYSAPGVVTLKDTTLEGGYYINGTGTKTNLSGVVKLLPGANGTYGIMGSAGLAEIVCANLTEGSELVAANLNYSFADATAATAANGTIIKAIEGKRITVSGVKLSVVEDAQWCVNGHKTVEECQAAGCTEEIVGWTVLANNITKLPITPGYYTFPANSTINLTEQVNTNASSGKIYFDLRGSTVNQKSVNHRIMLVNGGAEVTFLDTVGGGKLANVAASMGDAGSGIVLYAHTGVLNIIGEITVDGSGVADVTSANRTGGAIYVLGNGTLNVDGATIKGNDKVSSGTAIYNCGTLNLNNATIEAVATAGKTEITSTSYNSSTPVVTIENSVVEGYMYNTAALAVKDSVIDELYHNATGSILNLEGVVEIALMRTGHEDCTIVCSGLTEGSQLIVSKGIYKFASSAVFNAALDAGIIDTADGYKFATETGAGRKVVAVAAE